MGNPLISMSGHVLSLSDENLDEGYLSANIYINELAESIALPVLPAIAISLLPRVNVRLDLFIDKED